MIVFFKGILLHTVHTAVYIKMDFGIFDAVYHMDNKEQTDSMCQSVKELHCCSIYFFNKKYIRLIGMSSGTSRSVFVYVSFNNISKL